MNVFFVFDDGALTTPPLGGTILPGVTRDSIPDAGRAEGRPVREERYSLDQWARGCGERTAQGVLRLRHRGGGLADRQDQVDEGRFRDWRRGRRAGH